MGKKLENGTIHQISTLYSQELFKIDGKGYCSILDKSGEIWESLRRCEEYLDLCIDVEFHPCGTIAPTWMSQNREKSDRIHKQVLRFGISQPLDPKKSCFELPPVILHRIVGSSPVVIIPPQDLPAHYDDKQSWQRRYLEDGKFLNIKIDVTQRKEDIKKQIDLYLDYYKELLNVPDKRLHTKQEFWQVHDMLKEGKTHTEIIKTLWPEEYSKGKDSDEATLAEKYKGLVQKYKKQELEHYDDRAYTEVYGNVQGDNLKLYTRLWDHNKKATRKIENIRKRLKSERD